MSKFKFIRMLIRMGPDAVKLFDFPGLGDSAKLRAWVNESLELLDKVADLTETDADDAVVDTLAAIVANDTAWDGLHALVSLLDTKDDDMMVGADDSFVADIAKNVGIDPILIITLLPYIFKAIRMFRKWRGK